MISINKSENSLKLVLESSNVLELSGGDFLEMLLQNNSIFKPFKKSSVSKMPGIKDTKSNKVYFYKEYMIKDFVEELSNNGDVVFYN